MKIYISADFEGVSGVVSSKQTFPGQGDFEWTCGLWIRQINEIVEGSLEAGAISVVVNEAHASMNYMRPDQLHPKASYISGYVKPQNQMEGLDSTFSGAVIMGHAKAGSANGTLNHSYVMRDIFDISMNGNSIGEFGMNAMWAAYHGVPVIMVVGDNHFAEEAKAYSSDIETAIIKTGISQFTAHHLSLQEANAIIRETAKCAVMKASSGEITVPTLPESFTLEITFSLSEIAHICSYIPGVERVDGRSIRFESKDFRDTQKVRIVCSNLALAQIRNHF